MCICRHQADYNSVALISGINLWDQNEKQYLKERLLAIHVLYPTAETEDKRVAVLYGPLKIEAPNAQ